ncbi:H-NS family nucleoid-associated regulatory protein [Falsirhodobacter sp. alg1]|uniref:H-NS histone family protein n=1 Tax=Falsirhodobacter sp. alg1 TaxID=1472418 RepID=UPI0005ED761C|nr:H-NS histone family protein [Falsirhodobacter sp. alg1]
MIHELETMELSELKVLKKRVEKILESFEMRRKKAALEALETMAKEQGFSLSDFMDAASIMTEARGQAAPKFANPYNPNETWSGRGRKPRWFIEAIKAGQTTNDLAI